MKVLLFLLPVLLIVQNTTTCNKNLYPVKNVGNSTSDNPATDVSIDSAIQQILYYTNVERQKANLSPLVKNDKLMAAAANYAALMADEGEFSHNINGNLPNRCAAVNYTWRYIGENIAANTILNGAVTVGSQWMKSSGHRANILNSNFTEIGIGIAYSKKTNIYYYCQDFGQPR